MVADCTIVDSYLSDDLIKPEVSSAKETIEDWFDGSVSNISIDNTLLPSLQPKEHWTPTLLSANSNIQKIIINLVRNKYSHPLLGRCTSSTFFDEKWVETCMNYENLLFCLLSVYNTHISKVIVMIFDRAIKINWKDWLCVFVVLLVET